MVVSGHPALAESALWLLLAVIKIGEITAYTLQESGGGVCQHA